MPFNEALAMIHFHTLQVKKITQETEDCVSITFHIPEELRDTFRFIQGQNLTIRKTFRGEEVRRNYSICTSPFDGVLKVAVKKVEGGLFSTYANEELKAGDFLEVLPPNGSFYTELNPKQKKDYVAFAAGSGITPLLSIIKTTLATELQSTFTLVFGNRTKTSIIFKEELEGLKDRYLSRFRIIHILSRERTDVPVSSGRIDKEKCRLLFDKLIQLKKVDDFFICGPEELIFTVRDFLLESRVPKDHIHFELFTIPGQKKSTVATQKVAVDNEGAKARISVKLDGITFDFDLAYGGQNILDAALKEGADLPYACKGGVCCTCKAKLLQGQVAMDVNWGLEQDEIDNGFILTCQSH
ncbi:MAG TPA: 1,2-phenylacetyl-CoA epoxidase subunit PaaE, partial [Chitinophagaceae bacterium]|nr:1,2-phenylacetyl-CoA epoxidase subunit PaaE [Chitinophagaceae bacterium]